MGSIKSIMVSIITAILILQVHDNIIIIIKIILHWQSQPSPYQHLPSLMVASLMLNSISSLWCTIFWLENTLRHCGHLQLCLSQTPWYLLSGSPSTARLSLLPSWLTEMAVEAATLGNSRGRVLDNCAGNKAPSLHITAVLRGENNQDRYERHA